MKSIAIACWLEVDNWAKNFKTRLLHCNLLGNVKADFAGFGDEITTLVTVWLRGDPPGFVFIEKSQIGIGYDANRASRDANTVTARRGSYGRSCH
jgi:hypothetical protein